MWALRLVGLVYALSSVWCVLNATETLSFLGFVLQSKLAENEFLTLYGGLQAGIAIAMLVCSFQPKAMYGALLFALVMSFVLAVCRWAAIVFVGGVEEALVLGLLESALALILFVAWRCQFRREST